MLKDLMAIGKLRLEIFCRAHETPMTRLRPVSVTRLFGLFMANAFLFTVFPTRSSVCHVSDLTT